MDAERRLNVVLPSGEIVSVPESVANESQLPRATGGELAPLVADEVNQERASGVAEGAKALAEGFMGVLTLGLFRFMMNGYDPGYMAYADNRAQYRAGERNVVLGAAAWLLLLYALFKGFLPKRKRAFRGLSSSSPPSLPRSPPAANQPTPGAQLVTPPSPSLQPLTSVADELNKLADLRAPGILTDEEFAEQKASLLRRSK